MPAGRLVIFLFINSLAAVLMVVISPPFGISLMAVSVLALNWDRATTAPLKRSEYGLIVLVILASVGFVVLGKFFWPDLELPWFERAIRHPATAAILWIVQATRGFRGSRKSVRVATL